MTRHSALLALLRAACVVIACLMLPAAAAPPERNALERGVKAAFLFKFASYVEWPMASFPQADTPVVIGVTGAEDVAADLERLVAGKHVNGRTVTVRRLKENEVSTGVHILFIGAPERARIAPLVKSAQQNNTLVVTETEGALALGSAINFMLIDGRVRFDAAPESAEKAGVKLSSRLLGVANSVRSGI